MSNVIGIDFGTTTSRVAIYEDRKVEIINNERKFKGEIINNELESRETPSCVAFTKGKILVGEEAIHNINLEPENTIYGVKQLIGATTSNPLPKMKHTDGERRCTPEEVTAILLTKLRETAERYLQRQVNKAIIVVPSYFRDSQRRAVISAGHEAGLRNIRLLNEPLAASMAYISRKPEVHGNLLVLSMGSGPVDISILSVNNKTLLVKAIGLNNRIGGEDFTKSLVEHYMGLFRSAHSNLKISKQAIWRLKNACETVKKKLSSSSKIKLQVHSFANGIDINEDVTTKLFNELNVNNFSAVQKAVREVLESVKMSCVDISKVILTGGSSRIPHIQNLLKDTFGNERVSILPNPDEATICGALTCEYLRYNEIITLWNNLPRSLKCCLGINKSFKLIHSKNTLILSNVPSNHTREIQIPAGVRSLTIYEEEGNNKVKIGNYALKTLEYDVLPKVEFRLDDNLILNVIELYKSELPIIRNPRRFRTVT